MKSSSTRKSSFSKILLVYKMSTYHYYQRKQRGTSPTTRINLNRKRFLQTHRQHYATLEAVKSFFRARGIATRTVWRGRRTDYSPYDLVVTVGGDGTFLEAARNVLRQPVVGINSDPQWSVGRYCIADSHNLHSVLSAVLCGTFCIKQLNRLHVRTKRQPSAVNCLNDILICHKTPAAMSRYRLNIGRINEEQRSSGIWISTAAGSTGAIRSAGGKVLTWSGRQWQYRPRELYAKTGKRYRLTGGVLGPLQTMHVLSLMKDGRIYVDGAHHHLPFTIGEKVTVRVAKQPLNFIVINKKISGLEG